MRTPLLLLLAALPAFATADETRLALPPARPIELDRRAADPAFVETRCAAFREAVAVLSMIWPDEDPARFAWARAVPPLSDDLPPVDMVQRYLNGFADTTPDEIAATRLFVSDTATCRPLFSEKAARD